MHVKINFKKNKKKKPQKKIEINKAHLLQWLRTRLRKTDSTSIFCGTQGKDYHLSCKVVERAKPKRINLKKADFLKAENWNMNGTIWFSIKRENVFLLQLAHCSGGSIMDKPRPNVPKLSD